MRILWLSHLIPYPPKGGVLQRAYYLLQQLARHHEVDLLALNQPNLIGPLFDDMEAGLREAHEVLGKLCRRFEHADIDSEDGLFGRHGLALKSLVTPYPYSVNWMTAERYERVLKSWLDQYDYDVVHIDTIGLASYYHLVKHLPCVLDHHNIESHMLIRRASKEPNILKRWYYLQEGRRIEKLEKRICPQVKMNITCSTLDSERLKEVVPGTTAEDIPNCTDIDYFRRDPGIAQTRSIIFVGTMNWYPNVEAVRFLYDEVWPKLKQAIPDIRADIVGANPPADIVAMCAHDDDFTVHGFVDDVRQYIGAAAVYVCPIMDGGGTKLKILDAMSMSKAIVAHPIACEGIDVEPGKSVCYAQSGDEYVEAIRQLIDDDALRDELGANARAIIEQKYSSDVVGTRLRAIFEACAD